MTVEYITSVVVEEPTAPARHVLGVAGALRDLGHAVTITSPRPVSSGNFSGLPGIERKSFRFYPWRGGWRLYEAQVAWHLRRASLSGVLPDVYYFRMSPSNWVAGAMQSVRRPKAVEINGLEILHLPAMGRVLEAADLILVGTEEMKRVLVSRYPHLRAQTLVQSNCGFSPADVCKLPKAAARLELRISADTTVLLMISGFQAHQDFRTAFEAASDVAKIRPVIFLAVGAGYTKESVERMAAEHFSHLEIRFTGLLSGRDLALHIAAADVCLNLMTAEKLTEGNGKAQKTIDYMAHERPVIESVDDRLPIPDWLNDGAYVVDAGDPAAVASMAARICDDPVAVRERCAAAARDISARFSWSTVVRPFLQAIGAVSND